VASIADRTGRAVKDLILLVLGAIAGVLAQLAFSSAMPKVNKRLAARRRRKATRTDNSATKSRNILAIYANHGLESSLYAPKTFPEQALLPILPHPGLGLPMTLEPGREDLVVLDGLATENFPVDQRLIRKKIARGADIWDGSSLYVKQMQSADDGDVSFSVGICNYFAYVTLAQRMSAECRRTSGEKPLLVKHFRDFSTAMTDGLPPIALAATATCVFESDSGPVVAVQRRSDAVVNAAGMLGVAPIFGLESNRIRTSRSKYSLVYYNFLKEFIEEFFGLEQVIRTATNPRADIDWIFGLPPAVDLIAQVNNGDLTLSCTGAGIDVSDGSLTLALLAHFHAPSYLDIVKSTAVGSWESAPSTQHTPAIDFVPIDDPMFEELANVDAMDPSSIFSLDLARLHRS
jgi:hypothetical protein